MSNSLILTYGMTPEEQAFWDQRKETYKDLEYSGVKKISQTSMILLPSFKRLWLEYLYEVSNHTLAIDFHAKTQEFWNNTPQSSG